MDEKIAKTIISQAIAVAQKNGVYSLKDSALIYQAMLALGIENIETGEPKRETETEPVTDEQNQ